MSDEMTAFLREDLEQLRRSTTTLEASIAALTEAIGQLKEATANNSHRLNNCDSDITRKVDSRVALQVQACRPRFDNLDAGIKRLYAVMVSVFLAVISQLLLPLIVNLLDK